MRGRGKCIAGTGGLYFLFSNGFEGESLVLGAICVCVRYYFNRGSCGGKD